MAHPVLSVALRVPFPIPCDVAAHPALQVEGSSESPRLSAQRQLGRCPALPLKWLASPHGETAWDMNGAFGERDSMCYGVIVLLNEESDRDAHIPGPPPVG